MEHLINFASSFWKIYAEATPFLLLGFAVAGLLHQFLPDKIIQQFLSRRHWSSVVKASLIGTPVPLCSCGVVPVGLELHHRGIGRPATTSFLIATPENGVDSLSLSYSLFGGFFTFLRVLFALVVANGTGLLLFVLEKAGWIEPENHSESKSTSPAKVDTCCEPSEKQSASQNKENGLEFILFNFLPKIAHWIIIGLIFAAFIDLAVPPNTLNQIPSSLSLVAAALIGLPLYVCASASTPIAYSLMISGLSPGACLVFLLTGPATNSANIPVYIKEFGPKTTAAFYIGIFLFSILAGYIVDLFIDPQWINLNLNIQDQHLHNHGLATWEWAAIIIFSLMLLHALKVRWLKNSPHSH